MVGIKLIAGLGNQMFQTAFIYSFAKKHHLNYFVPTKVIAPHVPGKDAYRFPGITYHSNPPELQEYKEKHFRYELIPPMDNVCFNGYWQSWKYFDEHRGDLLEAFDLAYKKNKGVISIHVRRGDYLTYPEHHPVVSEAYLGRAIYFFQQRGYFKFKCFSDDIEYCKKEIPEAGIEIEFVEGQDELQDLVDGSCCEHQIGSNSSFSWWQFYLNQNKNKMAVFPRRWFGPMLPHDISDLILPNSILL